MLNQNEIAPSFQSVNQKNQLINSTDYLGKKNIVLYFYPKDDTPGCTIEANDFTALADEFSSLETVVIGVSKDSCQSHQAFIDKFSLNLELLADTSGAVCEAYQVWQEVEKEGVKKMKIVRSTFVIDKKGQLATALYAVSPDSHAQKILEIVKSLAR
ncbi:MAG: peroxiredoxin [Methylococcales bacterium]|nr:peroxiredoxin [Methylococcales bacterium]